MADPATLAVGSLGASVAGSGISAIGALSSGNSQASMYRYQAGIAEMNRKIAENNTTYALNTGEQQAKTYGIQAAQRAGLIRAAQGASGIDVGSGSSVDVQKGQAAAKDIDLNTIRTNAARVAYGFQTQAAQATAQGSLYNMAATDAQKAGGIKALGSLISGAGSVSDKWLQMGQYGLGGDGGTTLLNSQPSDI